MSKTMECSTQTSQGETEYLRIMLLTLPSASPLSTFGAVEVFTEANGLNPSNKMYRVEAFSLESGTRFWPTQNQDTPVHEAENNLPLDTLLIVGGLEVEPEPFNRQLHHLIRAYSSRARRVVGVSSGTFLLAQAGLLIHKRATTHWTLAEKLTQAHQNIEFVANRLYVRDGKFYTSAGGSSVIDVALALIKEDFGTDLAIAVAKRLVIFVNRSDVHPQVSNVLLAQATEVKALSDLLVWISDNLRENLSVAKLARKAAMSQRNFARHFLREVGTSPGQYVTSLRVDAAMKLLSSSKCSLKQIAELTGFGSAANLRRSFDNVRSMTPAQYRLRFSTVTNQMDHLIDGPSAMHLQPPFSVEARYPHRAHAPEWNHNI